MSTLEEQKAEIERLVDRFALEMDHARQTAQEIGEKLVDIGNSQGPEALPVLLEAIKRFRTLMLRLQDIPSPLKM